jgi:hypothetical protein
MEQVEEIWKDVVGWEGLYEVSNLGRVKSLDKTIKHNNKNCLANIRGRLLKQCKATGYCKIVLAENAHKVSASVHRLVAEAFIPNSESKRTVNHKNGIKTDNRVENLEWATQKENVHHAYQNKLAVGKKWTRQVINTETGEIYNSVTLAAKMHNIPQTTMTNRLKRNTTPLRYYKINLNR